MKIIFKVFDSLKVVLKSKRSIFSFLKKGSSIASTQIVYSVKQYAPDIKTIIDVGANQGQFALASNHFYPACKIYSYEPVPETYSVLATNCGNVPTITTQNFALGSNTGEIKFFKNAYSHASSALRVSKQQADLLPHTAKEEEIIVAVKKLDDVFSSLNAQSPILLKLDVQGFEKEVLKGATNAIKQVDYLLFEASFMEMYDGEPLFAEMDAFVNELGFKLVAPVGLLQSDNLQILQMDMLYKRV